jgi:uncharacterized protein (TIGR03067 family)
MRKFLAGILIFGVTAVMLVQAQGGAATRLEGTWMLVGDGGEKLPDEYFQQLQAKLIVKYSDYEQNVQGKKLEAGKLRVDVTKNPATADFDITEGPEKGKKQLAIFKFEGEKLIFAIAEAGSAARPKSFQPSKEVQIPIFKRIK